jgi:hypothetical protein
MVSGVQQSQWRPDRHWKYVRRWPRSRESLKPLVQQSLTLETEECDFHHCKRSIEYDYTVSPKCWSISGVFVFEAEWRNILVNNLEFFCRVTSVCFPGPALCVESDSCLIQSIVLSTILSYNWFYSLSIKYWALNLDLKPPLLGKMSYYRKIHNTWTVLNESSKALLWRCSKYCLVS